MSDSEEEKVERVKKPRTPAQQEAVKRMLEGRKKALALKKEEKEKIKQSKKELKKTIKKKVIEETSMLNGLSPEQLEKLRQRAIAPIDNSVENVVDNIIEEDVVKSKI